MEEEGLNEALAEGVLPHEEVMGYLTVFAGEAECLAFANNTLVMQLPHLDEFERSTPEEFANEHIRKINLLDSLAYPNIYVVGVIVAVEHHVFLIVQASFLGHMD